MITIQFSPGASVEQRLGELAEIVAGCVDAFGVDAFAATMNVRAEARKAAAEKAAAEKAAAAVPAQVKAGRGKRRG